MKRVIIFALLALYLPVALIGYLPQEPPKSVAQPTNRIVAEVQAEVVPSPVPTPFPTPEITWQDNPQGCNQETQWIAAESPFYCIDKALPLSVAQPIAVEPSPPVAPAGDKYTWLLAAGIPQAVWTYVDYIVTHESGWNPNAINPTSGACGLGQQLPCGKWAGAWNDPVAALVAMNGYVSRYGGWAGAYAFWVANRWY